MNMVRLSRLVLYETFIVRVTNILSFPIASYVICADGGANRLYDVLKAQGKESTEVRQVLSVGHTAFGNYPSSALKCTNTKYV